VTIAFTLATILVLLRAVQFYAQNEYQKALACGVLGYLLIETIAALWWTLTFNGAAK
jgi:hypothetical protein